MTDRAYSYSEVDEALRRQAKEHEAEAAKEAEAVLRRGLIIAPPQNRDERPA